MLTDRSPAVVHRYLHAIGVYLLLGALAVGAYVLIRPAAASAGSAAPPEDLGAHVFPVSTRSPEAHRAFDRGLTLAYGFSHQRAEKEFRRAAELDPSCAMAWWGVALVNGPHINFPVVPPDRAKTAWEALQKARARAPGASGLEQALIDALGKRYADPQPEDRAPLDKAYADAMRGVWRSYAGRADIAVLYAESLMDLRPWDLWTADGRPQPGTAEIVALLERALELDPDHPGANHLYIHTMEASPRPEAALDAADRLLDLVPASSHLVHMPSHIYARLGRWEDAAESNRRAIRVDDARRAVDRAPGFYAMYMAHNRHFLVYTDMMQGRSADAIRAARTMVAEMPKEFLAAYAGVADGFVIFPSEVLMRFGRWGAVLKEPEPAESFPLSRALWRFTRGVAYTALNRLDQAREEQSAFRNAAAKVPEGWTFGNNSAADLLAIASNVLDGELAAKEVRFDDAVKFLEEAVRIQDRLRYDEPPDWVQPVRHTLGAVLLRAGRYAEAEAVYREDLRQYPENGWSLYGLGRALRLQKQDGPAKEAEKRFEKAWDRADFKLEATCLCQPGV